METYSMDTAINKMSQFVLYCTLEELTIIYKSLKWRVENTPEYSVDFKCERDLILSIEKLHAGINK